MEGIRVNTNEARRILWWEEAAPWKRFDILNTDYFNRRYSFSVRSKEGKIWRRRLAKPGKTVELVGVENVRHLPRKDFSHLSPAGCSRLSFWTNERTNVINNPLVTRHGTLKHENLLIDRYRNHVAPYGTDLFAPPPLGGTRRAAWYR